MGTINPHFIAFQMHVSVGTARKAFIAGSYAAAPLIT